ncbi:filamentous hemagglutinin N-terminal domain-containing protein [Roseobacter sp. HKCCA0434]|uniref:filamentous hemagglutinin N-terminal domain-containing protein n=1 Tax=Roseobacter sp. HKCCA0434 TaxID=3079297 RepID=UPI0029058624|nr:filamentous hemagglutinin N-terminal domain-containing protein [Roseobacter sp. HKCCA0434]
MTCKSTAAQETDFRRRFRPVAGSRALMLTLLALVTLYTPFSAVAQPIVSDGGTATGITIGSAGLVTVDIAPANSASISHNTYSAFSVPAAGVDLDNSGVQAGTIINEVTSTRPTDIEGRLRIVGPQADVIVANPNGISVNGGEFRNTGNVALATGTLQYDAAGQVAATVTDGAIEVGAGGLSGTMEELALVSRALRIDGPLEFDATEPGSYLNVIAGRGTVSFDRVRNGFGQDGTGQLPWAVVGNGNSGATDAVIVDITGNGSVTAGRIGVTVTDRGAGVRFAGDQLAASGGFRLTSSGTLELTGASVVADGSVNISAGNIDLTTASGQQPRIASETSGVTILAQDGDIDLGAAYVSGRTVSSDNLASSGGVTFSATGDIVASGGNARIVSDAGDLPNAQNTSNVVLTADGRVDLEGVDITGTDDLRITAGGAVLFTNSVGEIGGDIRIFSNSRLAFDASSMMAQSDIRLDATELSFGTADPTEARSELVAANGGFTIRARAGDVINHGSLLQGRIATLNDPESRGGMTIYSSGDVLNRSLAIDRLAVAFGEQDNLYIEAGGDIRNETGRLFSNAGIVATAGGDILNETMFTAETAPLSVVRSRGARFATSLFLKRSSTTRVSADFGDRAISGEQSFILGVGDVSLDARNILNTGADITGADVVLTAGESISSNARQIGQVHFRQSCKWFCSTSGRSTLSFVGGTITASRTLSLTAGNGISSLAGTLTGADGITIAAPLTQFVPAFSPQLIEHPAGLTGGFRGHRGYLAGAYDYGTLQSPAGDIAIDGDADLGAATLIAAGTVRITGTRVESTVPDLPVLFERRPLGLLWNLLD